MFLCKKIEVMKCHILYCIFTVCVALLFSLHVSAQNAAFKTNGLLWLTASPNVGFEVAMNNKVTVDLSAAYNPWTFKDDKKMRFWLAQPEMKYWFCEKFEGHFVGVHLHAAQYFGGFKDKRYDGYLAGGGLSYGYDWILSPRWNLELALGVGYARLWYDKSPRISCMKCKKSEYKDYFGLTKAAISVMYIF